MQQITQSKNVFKITTANQKAKETSHFRNQCKIQKIFKRKKNSAFQKAKVISRNQIEILKNET